MPENEYVKIDMSKDVEAEIQFLKEENKRLVDEHERICNESAKRKTSECLRNWSIRNEITKTLIFEMGGGRIV